MNWIKENKFLSGVIAVVILGGGVLGYLLFTAMGKYDDASTNFDQQAGELHRLEALPVYPNAKNLGTLEKQREEYQTSVEDLQKSLEAMELPVEPMTPEQFQDRLKASVTAYDEKASAAHMKVPDKFFLGYEQYQAVPPRPEAAPLLGRELKAIEWVLDRLLEDGTLELTSIKPDELAEEKGEKEVRPESRQRNGPPGGGLGGQGSRRERAGSGRSALRKSAFTVSFVCEENVFQKILNEIVSAKSQYYIVRSFETKSTSEKPPMRDVPGALGPGGAPPPEPPPSAPPAPDAANPATPAPAPGAEPPGAAAAAAAKLENATKPGEITKFVVGEEKIQVALLIEIVTFATPPAEESKDGKTPPKPAQ